MKVVIKSCCIYVVLAFCGLFLSGCSDNPYAKFSGTWENYPKGGILRSTFDFANNSITFEGTDKKSSGRNQQQAFFTVEGKDDRIALVMQFPKKMTMVLEMQKDGTMEMKAYKGEHNLATLFPTDTTLAALSGRLIEPDSTMSLSRPKKEYDKYFPKPLSGYASLNGDWTTAESNKPIVHFDAKTKKITFLDTQYQKYFGSDVVTATRYEETMDNGYHRAELYLSANESSKTPNNMHDSYNLSLVVDLLQPFMEARLVIESVRSGRIVFRSGELLPKMSANDKAKWVALKKKEEEERIENERKRLAEEAENERKRLVAEAEEQKKIAEARAEEERQRLEAEAEKQKQLAEKRANMPEFTFRGITLSDSPQQLIDKTRNKYDISTSFSVQQPGTSIYVNKYNRFSSFGDIPGGSLVAEFLHRTSQDHSLGIISQSVKNSGLRCDYISLDDGDKIAENEVRTQIRAIYYTIPGKSPVLLYVKVSGNIVKNLVPSVYTERYGEPEERDRFSNTLTWLSNKSIAIISYNDLYIVSKPAYEEVSAYIKKVEDEEEAKRKMKEKAIRDNI